MRWGEVGDRGRSPWVTFRHLPQNTHGGVGQGVVSGQWQVMVGDSVGHQPVILCFPQRCVEVSKIVVKVNALPVPAALCPADQLRALPGKGCIQAKPASGQKEQGGPRARRPTRPKAVS